MVYGTSEGNSLNFNLSSSMNADCLIDFAFVVLQLTLKDIKLPVPGILLSMHSIMTTSNSCLHSRIITVKTVTILPDHNMDSLYEGRIERSMQHSREMSTTNPIPWSGGTVTIASRHMLAC